VAIGEELARVKAKVQICIVDACYSGWAITYLEAENRIVMTSRGENEKMYGGTLFHSFLVLCKTKVMTGITMDIAPFLNLYTEQRL